MPRKIRQLKADLRKAGFKLIKAGGKGSHTKWHHPLLPGAATLSGADGADARDYQERDVREWIRKAQEVEARQQRP